MPRPSFVLIMTDTQATNVLGCYGHPELRTPSIDRLAATGVTFDRAYTTSPLCTPARAGLFTGQYPHGVGAWVNGLPIGTSFPHMGQRFRDQGYRAAYTGKWHLDGHDYFGNGRCPDGWDDRFWYDGRRHLESLTDEERVLWRQGLRSYEALKEHDIQAEWTWGHRVSDRAIQFLQEAAQAPDQPFVLVASYDEPHGPFTCPPEFVEPFLDYQHPLGPAAFDKLRNKPVHQQEWAASRPRERSATATHPLYFGCNSFIDSEIGRVIDAVDRYAPDHTYILYTSDHGEQLGAHGLYSKGATVYEENTNIPLIVRPPRSANAGAARVAAPVSHIDILPTMLDLAGLAAPPALEGESLVPMLQGKTGDPERAVFVEFHRYEMPGDNWGGFTPMRAIVKGQHKLAIHLLDTDELYDLGDDPAELHNRIDDPAYATVRDSLHDTLLDWMYHSRDPFRGPAWERRPWRTARRLTWSGGWSGRRRGWDDGYAPSHLNYGTGLPLETA
ncbi:MAG: sulfatase-like hydrolase/transferase [Chloroflexota bacterium]